eukprot:1144612-Pelagomonas_calceolata.AAC.2
MAHFLSACPLCARAQINRCEDHAPLAGGSYCTLKVERLFMCTTTDAESSLAHKSQCLQQKKWCLGCFHSQGL